MTAMFIGLMVAASWRERRRQKQRKRERMQRYQLQVLEAVDRKNSAAREAKSLSETLNYGTAFWADPRRWEGVPCREDGWPEPFWMYQHPRHKDYIRL
jgi:hypothetical protein